MLYIGIDVAKLKHDCFITNTDGEALCDVFSFQNSKEGFLKLYSKIKEFEADPSSENTRIGLEATGHYDDNLVSFLRKMDVPPVILNPLQVNLYRKGQSLRKTKTDKSDAKFIAKYLMSEGFKPIPSSSYHSDELKSLTRYRWRLVRVRSNCKVSYDRLLTLLFPELEGFVGGNPSLTEFNVFLEFPGAGHIADAHLTHLTNIARKYSRGRFGKEWATGLRKLARDSIGMNSHAKSMELRQVIEQILFMESQIEIVEKEIKALVIKSGTTLMTIPGISYTLAAIITAEIGNIFRFANPDKLQAFAGLDPSIYQSGQFVGTKDVMVKRGSTYLRWALLMAARTVSMFEPTFAEYRDRKTAEGKHYNCAMTHVAKKLIRVIFHLMVTGETYQKKI